MSKKIDVNEFCERVNKAYDGRISVVKETYIDTRHKVTAYCNVHQIYFECDAQHLDRGRAKCPQCAKENKIKLWQNNKKKWSEVYNDFIKKYKDKFSYDESTYNGTKELMKIHCNDCGEDFEISPFHHLKYNNGGCPNCSKKRIAICSLCGEEFEVDKHISSDSTICYCKKCRKKKNRIISEKFKLKESNPNISEQEILDKISYCKICGRKLNDDLKCDNEFCNRFIQTKFFDVLIEYFGFDKNKFGTEEVENEFNRIRNILYDMYWTKRMSLEVISNSFNYTGSHLDEIFKKLKIKIKDQGQSIRDSIETGRRKLLIEPKQFKYSYHTTWDNKTVFLRSSYEKEYATYLDDNKIPYDVESLRIPYFDTQQKLRRIALPDFYLPETNTIVEVKSKWPLDKQNMIDKRKAYLELGYNFKLLYEHEFVELDDLEQKDNINNHRK